MGVSDEEKFVFYCKFLRVCFFVTNATKAVQCLGLSVFVFGDACIVQRTRAVYSNRVIEQNPKHASLGAGNHDFRSDSERDSVF